MTSTATFTPAAQELLDLFRSLSVDERERVRETIVQSTEEAIISESHWEILQERELLHAQGLDQAIPADEAFRQIRARLRQARQAAS
jgi:hypothetical protein